MANLVDNNLQFYLRIASLFIGVLLTAKWYRSNYPSQKNVMLLVLVALYMGLYMNNI